MAPNRTRPGSVALPRDEGRDVRAILDDLGLAGIIDVHTHFMPPQVMAKVWAYFDEVERHTGRAWPIAYRLDEKWPATRDCCSR